MQSLSGSSSPIASSCWLTRGRIWPGSDTAGGRKRNPAGPAFKDFGEFLSNRPAGSPFAFWYGGHDINQLDKPVVKEGVNLSQFKIPGYLPDCEAVRNDFYQYFQRLREFDAIVAIFVSSLRLQESWKILSLLSPPTTGLTCRADIPIYMTPGRASFLPFAGSADSQRANTHRFCSPERSGSHVPGSSRYSDSFRNDRKKSSGYSPLHEERTSRFIANGGCRCSRTSCLGKKGWPRIPHESDQNSRVSLPSQLRTGPLAGGRS